MSIRAEQTEWEIAQAQNTPAAYQEYLDRHPAGKYASEARRRINSKDTPEQLSGMVFIQGGTFEMGDCFRDQVVDDKLETRVYDSERGHWVTIDDLLHPVTVSDYYLGRNEVTFAEYAFFCAALGKKLPDDEGWGREKRPVINVSWYDAVNYCNWLSEKEKLEPVYNISDDWVAVNWSANGYRLPTEAEFEFAARSRGKKENWSGTSLGEELSNFANYDKSKYKFDRTAPVRQFKPNELGLYDMSGNVWEWCWDWYGSEYYKSSNEEKDPHGPISGTSRVYRGGSWKSSAELCRTSVRFRTVPNYANEYIGFRLARNAN